MLCLTLQNLRATLKTSRDEPLMTVKIMDTLVARAYNFLLVSLRTANPVGASMPFSFEPGVLVPFRHARVSSSGLAHIKALLLTPPFAPDMPFSLELGVLVPFFTDRLFLVAHGSRNRSSNKLTTPFCPLFGMFRRASRTQNKKPFSERTSTNRSRILF